MSKSLRLKSFQPEEEYVYLTYSLKNDKKETKILLENYKHLLQKALDWLWERTKIERKEVKKGKKIFAKVKVTLPKKKEVYIKFTYHFGISYLGLLPLTFYLLIVTCTH